MYMCIQVKELPLVNASYSCPESRQNISNQSRILKEETKKRNKEINKHANIHVRTEANINININCVCDLYSARPIRRRKTHCNDEI